MASTPVEIELAVEGRVAWQKAVTPQLGSGQPDEAEMPVARSAREFVAAMGS